MDTLHLLDRPPSLSEMLPLVREGQDSARRKLLLVITERYVCCVEYKNMQNLPAELFLKGSDEALLRFVAQLGGCWLCIQDIRNVGISLPIPGEYEHDYGGWYGFYWGKDETSGFSIMLSPEEAVLPLLALETLASMNGWEVARKAKTSAPPHLPSSTGKKSVGILKSVSRFVWRAFLVLACGGTIGELCLAAIREESPPPTEIRVKIAILIGLVYWTFKTASSANGSELAKSKPASGSQSGSSDLGGRQPLRSHFLHWVMKVGALLFWWGYFQIDLPDYIAKDYWISTVVAALVTPVVAKILHWSHRMAVSPWSTKVTTDKGAICVYLRSFHRDEAGSFNKQTWTNASFGLSSNIVGISKALTFSRILYMSNPLTILRLLVLSPRETAEEQLLGRLAKKMSVVAIGKPGDRLASLGAKRAYVSDDEWQEVVLSALDKANMVIIQPGASRHIFWEIDRSLERVDRERILFWLSGLEGHQARYDLLRIHLERQTGLTFPRQLGAHSFLAIVSGVPRMLSLVEGNPFAWPLHGSRVDIQRSLAPVLQHGKTKGMPAPPLPHFLSPLLRSLTTFSAFCFWQLTSVLFCFSFLTLTGLARESWTAWDLRRVVLNSSLLVNANEKTSSAHIQWSLPSGWKPVNVYSWTRSSGKKDAKPETLTSRGWAYGSGAFMQLVTLPMTPELAAIYERSPANFLLQELAATHNMTFGPVSSFDQAGRKWVQAEFTSPGFGDTWTRDTSILRIFTKNAKGVARSTLGPEGLTTVWAFSPPTSSFIAQEPLLRLLESLQIFVSPFAGSRDFDALAVTTPSKDSLQTWQGAALSVHRLEALPELELMLSAGWKRKNETTFTMGESAWLEWSFRPSEITDLDAKTAAERDIRRFELSKKLNCKILSRSQSDSEVTLECEASIWSRSGSFGTLEHEVKHVRMIQRTWVSPLGVLSARALCARGGFVAMSGLLLAAVDGARWLPEEGSETATASRLSAAALDNTVTGSKTPYILSLHPGWTAEEESYPSLDKHLVLSSPLEATLSVEVEDVAIPALSQNRWQTVVDDMVKRIAKSVEGRAVLQQRETLVFAGVAGHNCIRVRLHGRSTSGEFFQRTAYLLPCARKFYTIHCFSLLKSPHSHDSIFDPIIRQAKWVEE